MKILSVVGARPNFMKMAPLVAEMRRYREIEGVLIHTGQHYDAAMSGQFFRDLGLPVPDASLEVGPGSHAQQTAEIMRRLEPVLEAKGPDVLLVVGDVNSTMAAALTAAKLGIPIAHVEAGLRSFDRSMPEEINRILTDAVSDHFFVTEESGRLNLLREGRPEGAIHLVGNVMIDCLERFRPAWERSDVISRLGLAPREYGVVTLHRPSNVDEAATLRELVSALGEVARRLPLVFPVHPRTRKRLTDVDHDLADGALKGVSLVEPLGYLDFIALVAGARLVLTDSGGLQEETTALGVPCLTVRENTERPVTVSHGTNRIVGTSPARLVAEAASVLDVATVARRRSRPPLWDGRASERIVAVLRERVGC